MQTVYNIETKTQLSCSTLALHFTNFFAPTLCITLFITSANIDHLNDTTVDDL